MEYACDDPDPEATRGRDDTCDHTAGCVPARESDPVFVDPNSQGCFIMFLFSYTFQHHANIQRSCPEGGNWCIWRKAMQPGENMQLLAESQRR